MLLFMDSFDHYATADITEKWTSLFNAAHTIGAYGRNSTNGLRLGDQGGPRATVLGGVDEAIMGFAFKAGAAPSTCSIMGFGSATVWECGLMLQADMTLRPYRNNNSGFEVAHGVGNAVLIGSSTSVALQVGVWAYIEVRMKCHDTLGTCIVRINGTEVLNLTGLDTLYTSAVLTRVGLGSNIASYAYFDDLVVMNTTGSLNNSFMGDVTISALLPTGAGNSSGWTPSAGSNYDCVNEASPNDDTDYVSTAALTTKDLYAFADAPAGADIRAVQVLAAVRKGAEGPGQVKLVTRSNSTDYDGVAQGIGGTAYSYVREVYETDPATAAAWSESGFNAAEFGLKKTG
jgi:hypothetical protein